MKKLTKLLTLCGTVVPALIIIPTTTSCKSAAPSDYDGNMNGKNWKGWESGSLTLSINIPNKSFSIDSNVNYVAKNLIIPKFIIYDLCGCRFPLTVIDHDAFKNCLGLTGTLTIGSNIKSIERNAFYGCNKLTGNLIIPGNVKIIDNSAFYQCTGLTKLNINNGVNAINDKVFYECTGLMGDLIFPDSIVSVGDSAFNGCSNFTGNLIIPNSVTIIGETAFKGCPDNFFTCINNVYYDKSDSPICFGNYGSTKPTGNLIINDKTRFIADKAFYYCQELTGILNIPDSVKNMGEKAFYFAKELTGLTIGKGLNCINNSAFRGCTKLSGNLEIPDSITTIEANAFYECVGFNGTLKIGAKVTNIEEYAFYGCASLAGDLIVPNSVKTIGNRAFYKCPDGIFNIENNIYYDKSSSPICFGNYGPTNPTGILTINDKTRSIAASAFNACSTLDNGLTIPDSVKTISDYAFTNCVNLTGLTIGNGVTYIGISSFSGCTGLKTTLIIKNNVEDINNNAFYRCNGFTELIFDGYTSSPKWKGIDSFKYWNNGESFSGTVSVVNAGSWTAEYALSYAQTKGLSNQWTI